MKVPEWKRAMIIFLVIAMPLFFSFARTAQLQQALRFNVEMQAMQLG